jgi:hemoglobin/transferrin/lactoferrin receptor protein
MRSDPLKLTTILFALTLTLALAPGLGAEPTDCAQDESCAEGLLEEIVVTGTRTRKSIMQSPVSLNLLTTEQIDRINADNVADLLRDLPGMSVSDSGQAGLKRIRIRGEEARRIALLIDGQEFTDHREVGVPMLIDPGMIDRIEVVRGPASVLYGAKALSGVVNIITKRGGAQPLQANLSNSFNTATNGHHTLASLFGDVNDFYYRLSLSNNDQNDRETPAGDIENTSYESDSIAFNLGRAFSGSQLLGDQSIEMVYENFDSASEVYVEPEQRFAPPFLDFAIDAPQRDREKLGVFYQFEPDNDYLVEGKINVFRQVSDRQFDTFASLFFGFQQDSSIFTASELTSDGGVAQLDWQLGTDHYLITGIQYNRDRVEQSRHREVRINLGVPSMEDVDDRSSMTTWAFFIQDEWDLADNWDLTAGLRSYKVDGGLDATTRTDLPTGDRDDDHVIGSVSLLYSGFDNTTLRATFSQGYLYPSLLQLAMGAYAGSRYVNPDLELEPETSDTFELGLRHQGSQWAVDATVFYTEAENYIDHLFCTTEDQCLGSRDKKYKNISQAESYGVELDLQYQPLDSNLNPYGSIGWYHRNNDYATFSTSDSGIPAIQGRVGFRWQRGFAANEIWTDIHVRFESSSELEEPGSTVIVKKENSGWGSLNADVGFNFGKHYSATMNLFNLTDKKYSTSTENLLAAGRSIRVKLAIEI